MPDRHREPRMADGTFRKLAGLAVSLLLVAAIGLMVLNRRVDHALQADVSDARPVDFLALPERSPLPFWGGEDIESVVALPGGVYVAGGFGVARLESMPDGRAVGFDRIDISAALPTRRASRLSAWRSDLVAGLDSGGLFVYRVGSWSEVRSGFGELHVRDLVETPAGELWIGAREGLFRLGLAERSMARLHTASVRSVALGDGGRVVSGGETGLFVTEGRVTSRLKVEGAETAWVEEVAVFGRRIFAVTPTGLVTEEKDGVLRAVAGGENVASVAVANDRLFATAEPSDSSLRWFDPAGRVKAEQLPSVVRRVFPAADRLLADTADGLAERFHETWRLIAPRRQRGSFGGAHIGALAVFHRRVVIGFFDGGLAELVPSSMAPVDAETQASELSLRPITDRTSPIWAVNALLDAGGALHVASLRGAFRFDGSRVVPLEGTGAAFSLAQTRGGVAIGFGEGVLLPEQKLLSAFHGLPGNQATALSQAEGGLLVGTPSGLGYVEGRRVLWRVASGEGKLPHPWVTALVSLKGSALVGTYGGGITRRVGSMSDKAEWKPFPETEGLKVNTGCLIEAKGRIYMGTDGTGLFRLSVDGTRFERLMLALPSLRITALLEKDGYLYVGTDEGLTRWPVEQDDRR
ncbi:MAG: hypothetical protein JJE39_15305 [Vicinamibacteria bacterium]|nr:hypothetical protein [Vicinamibacteria bacterium]